MERTGRKRSPAPDPAQVLDSSADSLSRYMGELQNYGMLNARQERELAREIEELERAYWRALLSYRPALEIVAVAARDKLPSRARRLEALRRVSAQLGSDGTRDPRWEPALAAAARELRKLDLDRSAARAALAAALSFKQDGRARAYLSRVHRAAHAQETAKARFVTANLRLVVSMASRYDRSLLPLADLIQEGNCGLMRAVERFDHRRGFRFSTYAGWWIRHSLNRALSDKARLVRVPVHTLDALSRLRRAAGAITAATGEPASVEELAERTGLSKDKVAGLSEQSLSRPLSLDRSVGEDQDQPLYDLFAGVEDPDLEQRVDLARWCEELPQFLEQLPSIEAAVLRFRFGLDDGQELTLREIGDKYNLSRERIRQLESQALRRLRGLLKAAGHAGSGDNGRKDAA